MTINVNILIIFVPLLFGFIVGSFSKPDTWYSKLNKQLLASAIITLLILLTAIIVIYQFYTYKQYISVYLLIPYIIWLLFANYLAWSVYLLN